MFKWNIITGRIQKHQHAKALRLTHLFPSDHPLWNRSLIKVVVSCVAGWTTETFDITKKKPSTDVKLNPKNEVILVVSK